MPNNNEWREIQGIRLPSEVHANKTYTPDLFVANRARHSGLIIDVKRSLGSYAENKLETLRFRMLAVAAIASSWLGERQGPVLVEVSTAIIDGADISSDHERGVFKISEIGDLLEVDEAGEAMTRLRDMFAERVQHALEAQCRKIIDAATPVSRQSTSDSDLDNADTENARRGVGNIGAAPARACGRQSGVAPANIRVGFARSRANP